MDCLLERAVWFAVAGCGLVTSAFGVMRIRAMSGADHETTELQARVLALFCVIFAGIFAAVCGMALAGGLVYL